MKRNKRNKNTYAQTTSTHPEHVHVGTREHTNACLGNVHCVLTNTDGDEFSAADRGTRGAPYDEMDMADQPQQKLNNALYVTLFQSPSLHSFFSYTSKPSPPPPTPPLSSILLPSLFISALSSCSILFILPIFHRSHIFPLPPLVPDLKRTPRQTAEQSDSRDQTFILNYNPSK